LEFLGREGEGKRRYNIPAYDLSQFWFRGSVLVVRGLFGRVNDGIK
jgi:hypothetical protein